MSGQQVLILLEEHEEIATEGLNMLEDKNYKLVTFYNNDKALIEADDLDFDAIMVRGAKISSEFMKRFPNIKVIARCGVGTDNIDIKAATKKGIYICNVPDANFTSVAEHVIGMITVLSHQIVKADKAFRKGHFDVRHRFMGSELKGKTIGVIGYGRVGRLVAQKCTKGLDMNVITYDPYVQSIEQEEDIRLTDNIDKLLKESDFITLHLPYLPALHHFINEQALLKMKKTAYLINCARGGLVDEVALASAITNNEIAGAGIDVFENEPPKKDNDLLNLENVVVTPHMAASTKDSLTLMAVGAAEEVIRVLNGYKPRNAVN